MNLFSNRQNDRGVGVKVSPYIGTILTELDMVEKDLLDSVGVGVVRTGIPKGHFAKFPTNSNDPFWQLLHGILQENAHLQWFLTVPPTHDDFVSKSNPPIPETKEDIERFRQFVIFLVERYGQYVSYWQLGNELHSPDNWPPDRYERYAELLTVLHDEVTSRLKGAKIALAGLRSRASLDDPKDPLPRQLLEVVARQASQNVHLVDLHHHFPWKRGSFIGERLQRTRSIIQQELPSLAHVNFVVTECSTYSDQPVGKEPQTEREQAVYAVEATYAALASGALFVMVGTLRDRLKMKGSEQANHFTLNGMFLNPQKQYTVLKSTRGNLREAKAVAYTCQVLTSLTSDVPANGFRFVETGKPNLQCVEVLAASGQYRVLWVVHGGDKDVAKDVDDVRIEAAPASSLQRSDDLVIEPVVDSYPRPAPRATRGVARAERVKAIPRQAPISVKKDRPVILMPKQD